jgi:class 3 adenylate cyclase
VKCNFSVTKACRMVVWTLDCTSAIPAGRTWETDAALRLTLLRSQPRLVPTDDIGAPMSDPIAVSRRVVAVFAADVEGYSRLMGADEVGTLRGLTERRAILDRIIEEYRGRIANTAGDSVLAEFGSAVDAIECAVA